MGDEIAIWANASPAIIEQNQPKPSKILPGLMSLTQVASCASGLTCQPYHCKVLVSGRHHFRIRETNLQPQDPKLCSSQNELYCQPHSLPPPSRLYKRPFGHVTLFSYQATRKLKQWGLRGSLESRLGVSYFLVRLTYH